MKIETKTLALIAAVGVVLIAIVLSLGSQKNAGMSTITGSVETIYVSPASADWYPGTTASGDIVASQVIGIVGVNSTLAIKNATMYLYNNSALLATYNTSASDTFPYTFTVPLNESGKSQTYYMNFTAYNNSQAFRGSTQTYNNRNAYGTATVTKYGTYVVISGDTEANVMSTYAMYYQGYYISAAYSEATSSSTVSNTVLIIRPSPS